MHWVRNGSKMAIALILSRRFKEDMMTIITNNVPRETIRGFELTEREKDEFDYLSPEELNDAEFFRYKNRLYDLGEFVRFDRPTLFKGWDGYSSDSFFSGILVRYHMEYGYYTDKIVVGWYYC
jgi:hypothetical protein